MLCPSRFAALAVTAAALFCAAPLATAQSLTSASTTLRVTDEARQPIFGAILVLTEVEGGVTRELSTPRDGTVNLAGLSPGEYSLRAEQVGYVPRVIVGITLRPGNRVDVPVVLAASPGPLQRVDTVAFSGGALAGIAPGRATELSISRIQGFPFEERRLSDLFGFSTAAGDGFEVEGLPGALSGIRVDGVQVGALDSYALVPGSHRSAALPLSMFGQAVLTAGNPDVEWAGHAGGSIDLLSATTRQEGGLDVYGRWSGAGLRQEGDDGIRPIDQLLEAGVRWAGPIVPDSAYVSAGLEVIRRMEQPLITASAASDDVSQIARDIYGLAPVADRSISLISGFATAVWEMSPTTRLDIRSGFGLVPTPAVEVSPSGTAWSRAHEGLDILVSGTLTSRFNERVYQEARFGFETVSRTFADADPFGQIGATRVGAGGLSLGPAGGGPRDFGRWVLRMSETVHVEGGAHRFKIGLAGNVSGVDVGRGRDTGIWVANAAEFAAGNGYIVSSQPSARDASYVSGGGSVYAQDTWTAASGFDLLFGARFDLESLPSASSGQNLQWLAASGLDNTNVAKTWWRLSPRLGFTWDVQDRHTWVIGGSAGVYSGSADPVILADWLAGVDGGTVQRGYGSLSGWPDPSPTLAGGTNASTLTLLNSGFEGPRTARADLGVGRALGPNTVFRLSGVFRRTEFLPRVSDLNLNADPREFDQYGRPVFGSLEARQGLLFPAGDTNRRFSGFDRVLAIEVDGVSTYRGVTAGLDHRLEGGAELFASYTLSSTVDNLFAGGGYAAEPTPAPRLPESAGDWVQSTSDFDVPHRVLVGADVPVPVVSGSRLAVLYRFRSGDPFTPGFPNGVDADGDGTFGNAPAFVDRSVAGLNDVAGSWDCLSADNGDYATRNGCRGDAIHSLDARLTLGVLNSGRYRGALLVEALNLLGSERSRLDTALYRVDPAAALVRGAGGTVTVPLLVNEDFGQPIESLSPGRVFRVGFRMEF